MPMRQHEKRAILPDAFVDEATQQTMAQSHCWQMIAAMAGETAHTRASTFVHLARFAVQKRALNHGQCAACTHRGQCHPKAPAIH